MKFESLININYTNYLTHKKWMNYALEIAREAGEAGEIPVGVVMVDKEGKFLTQASNRKERDQNPTAHAEILAIQAASKILQTWHLNQCTMYVTLEPCPMCTGAIIQARIGQLVYGADDPKTGTIRTVANLPDSFCSNHRLSVLAGIMESHARKQLQSWFMRKRQKNNNH